MQNNTSQHKWLLDRGISEEVLHAHGIICDDKITIPVQGTNGVFLFNKYRKNPFIQNDAPKYMYDKGATSALYNAHLPIKDNKVFICEGELDCLRLNSMGLSAVSSTGGAGTFKKAWAFLLQDVEVFICLDSDEAGAKGAIKIQQMIPHAKWVAIEHAKDVTEYILKFGEQSFLELVEHSRSYTIPQEDEMVGIDKKICVKMNKVFGQAANEIVILQQTDRRKHLDIIRLFLLDRFEHYKYLLARFVKTKITSDDLTEIKRIPMDRFIDFNQAGFAKCMWHADKDASLHYYPKDNRAYCFGACQRNFDVIDAIMLIENINFGDAIKRLKSL